MLPTNYNYLRFALVTDLMDFYKSRLPEINQIKGIFENLKILYNLSSNKISLSVSQGDRIYRFDLLSPGINKEPLGHLIYIPKERRIELYSYPSNSPSIQWKNRKIVYSIYPDILIRANLYKLFEKIINLT